MVAWDGERELGGVGIRWHAAPFLLGWLALTVGWTAALAFPPPYLADPKFESWTSQTDSSLAPPWTGPATTGIWRSVGPSPIVDERCCGRSPRSPYGNASGRITSLAVDPTSPAIVYAGSAGGGVWKTVDGGASWVPLTDNAASLAVGALAIDPTGQVLYAGTGEADGAEDALPGAGILKSTDRGASWSLVGQQFAGARVGGLAVDRTIAGGRRILAATSRGLYLSIDGGSIWSLVRAGGATSVAQDPTDASHWWLVQTDFCEQERGQVLISRDHGLSWSASLTAPAMSSSLGLGIGPGGVAYVAIASCGSAPLAGNLMYVGRTADEGAHWTSIPLTTPGLTNYFRDVNARAQGYYDNVVGVDPSDARDAVFGGVTMLATRDGGASFIDIGRVYHGGSIHPDFHTIAFTGRDTFYAGNDGGVWKTSDLGGSGAPTDWSNLNSTLGTVQFYEGTALDGKHLVGGAQDNGTVGTLTSSAWSDYYVSDGGYTAASAGSNTIYVESPLFAAKRTYFQVFRGDASLGATSFIPAGPCADPANDPACLDPHAEATVPFVMDPTRPNRLLLATDRVYQTLSGGIPSGSKGWSPISGPLTTGRPGDWISALTLGGLDDPNLIVTGSRFGKVYLSRDAGRHWADITGNLPLAAGHDDSRLADPIPLVTSIAVDLRNPAEIWVGLAGLGVPHLWHRSLSDAGRTASAWSPVDRSALPDNLLVTSIVVDPRDPSRVYAGTINGVLMYRAGAPAREAWERVGAGLPNAWVASLTVSLDGKELVVWSHGRGAWVLSLNDIGPN